MSEINRAPYVEPRRRSVGRDGRQGWSRASEAGWERVFGERARELAEQSPYVARLLSLPADHTREDS